MSLMIGRRQTVCFSFQSDNNDPVLCSLGTSTQYWWENKIPGGFSSELPGTMPSKLETIPVIGIFPKSLKRSRKTGKFRS